MPKGIPRRVSDAWERERAAPLVRVVVYLERSAIEDLELIMRYRHGVGSRSQVVREAVMAMRAREAAYLARARAQRERRRQEAADLEAARSSTREERERASTEELVAGAVAIARGEAD